MLLGVHTNVLSVQSIEAYRAICKEIVVVLNYVKESVSYEERLKFCYFFLVKNRLKGDSTWFQDSTLKNIPLKWCLSHLKCALFYGRQLLGRNKTVRFLGLDGISEALSL